MHSFVGIEESEVPDATNQIPAVSSIGDTSFSWTNDHSMISDAGSSFDYDKLYSPRGAPNLSPFPSTPSKLQRSSGEGATPALDNACNTPSTEVTTSSEDSPPSKSHRKGVGKSDRDVPAFVFKRYLAGDDDEEIDPMENSPREGRIVKESARRELDRLQRTADGFLHRGRNAEALDAYRRAVEFGRNEIVRVRDRIEESQKNSRRVRFKHNDRKEGTKMENALDKTMTKIGSKVAGFMMKIGFIHEVDRKYDTSLRSYQDALDMYQNICQRYENDGDADVDLAVHNIKRMEMAKSSHEKRKMLHQRADKFLKQSSTMENEIARYRLQDEVVKILKYAIHLEMETLGPQSPAVARSLMKMGKVHYEMKRFDTATEDIRKAIEILQNSLGRAHPQVSTAQLFLASVFGRLGSTNSPDGLHYMDKSLELYVDSLESLKACLGEVHPKVGSAYNKVGVIYYRRGDRKLARIAFDASLKAYTKESTNRSGKEKKVAHPDATFVWVNLGKLYSENKEWDECLTSYGRALCGLRHLNGENKALCETSIVSEDTFNIHTGYVTGAVQRHDGENYSQLIASTLKNIGTAHAALQHYGEALEVYEEALVFHQNTEKALDRRLKKRLQDSLVDSCITSSVDAAKLLKKMGELQIIVGNLDAALGHYVQSLSLFRARSDAGIDLPDVLGCIGLVHVKREEYAKAMRVLSSCLQMYKENGVPADNRACREASKLLRIAEKSMAKESSPLTKFNDKLNGGHSKRLPSQTKQPTHAAHHDSKRVSSHGLEGARKSGNIEQSGNPPSNNKDRAQSKSHGLLSSQRPHVLVNDTRIEESSAEQQLPKPSDHIPPSVVSSQPQKESNKGATVEKSSTEQQLSPAVSKPQNGLASDGETEFHSLLSICPKSHHDQLRSIYDSSRNLQVCSSLVATWVHLEHGDADLKKLLAICPPSHHKELREVFDASRDVETCRSMVATWIHLDGLNAKTTTQQPPN